MLETMDQSPGNAMRYRAIGTITNADYPTLDPAVAGAIKQNGLISLLFDLSQLKWEKPSVWPSDLDFGNEFKNSIGNVALVADARWAKAAAQFAEPY